MKKTDIYLGLGSNIGDRHTYLLKAIELLVNRVGTLVRSSSFIESEPQGFESAHSFLNAVVLLQTTLTPRELLKETQQIERELGRTDKRSNDTKDTKPVYHDRTIDIDILIYGDQHIDEPDLQIPHPRIEERAFVMVPLREVQTPTGRIF